MSLKRRAPMGGRESRLPNHIYADAARVKGKSKVASECPSHDSKPDRRATDFRSFYLMA